MKGSFRLVLLGVAFAGAGYFSMGADAAQVCDKAAFGALIDDTARILRTLNRDSEKRFQDRLQALGRARSWSASQMADKAASAMEDERLSHFNGEIEDLVTKLDTLSSAPKNDVSCDRLDELRAVRDRLVTVMGQKSGFVLAQLEAGAVPPARAPARAPGAQDPQADASDTSGNVKPSWPVDATTPPASEPSAVPPASTPTPSTAPAIVPRPAPKPVSIQPSARIPPPPRPAVPVAVPPEPLPQPLPSGFSAQEIRAAGEGVFGKLTSEFAVVMNYVFQKYGQPNGYIIGNEGGGAFLAGLRYGDGKLYTRAGGGETGPVTIFWQGPSVGVDVGATGSRVMFLVYNLDSSSGLYRRFAGLDGSAYVAGGVGLTVFQSGNTVVVPIRTGLGLRLGASLAFLKFTDHASWNPF